MDFRAGTGVENVDGMSGVFGTYFTPQGYALVERTQIDRVIVEQGFQRSSLTQQQMVEIGQLLNLQNIVVGDIVVLNGQYDIDVRVVDVETGEVKFRDGETWAKGITYRDAMRNLAERLVSKMNTATAAAISSGASMGSQSDKVVILFNYLKVYPEDLGDFPYTPVNVISALNSEKPYGYDDWRVPTIEEMALIKANRAKISGIGTGEYMTSDGKKSGNIRLVTTGETFAAKEAKRIREEMEQRKREAAEEEQKRQAEIERLHYFVNNEFGIEVYEKDLVADQPCPDGWRIPTMDEMKNLAKIKDKIGLADDLYIVSGRRFETMGTRADALDYAYRPYKDEEVIRGGTHSIAYKDGFVSHTDFHNYQNNEMLQRCVRTKPAAK